MGSSGRTYNEREIGALMKRATELHESSVGTSNRHLSLEEVETLAAELGLPAAHVREAALELEHGEPDSGRRGLFGGPFVIDETRVVAGEVSDSIWEDVVLDLRQFTGRTGQTSLVGRAREWSHYIGEGDEGINFTRIKAMVRPRDGQTSIHLRKQFSGVAMWYPIVLVPMVSLMLAVTNAFPGPEVGIASLAAVAASMVLVRSLIVSWSDRQRENLKGLADQMRAAASNQDGAEVASAGRTVVAPAAASAGAATEVATAPATTVAAPVLEVPDEDETAEGAVRHDRTRVS
ncbi:MAG: hypothetical protein HKN29_00285 [Rhodothermales bacterium]|nr:hypothetical protein [Rhodothermales bacterium]